MSNIFNNTKNYSYSMNQTNNGFAMNLNSMYKIVMHVDFYQDKYANAENMENNNKESTSKKETRHNRVKSAAKATKGFGRDGETDVNYRNVKDNLKSLNDLTTIKCYVDQENLPSFSFDSTIENGFKSVLINEIQDMYKNTQIARFTTFSPNTYYTPLADENTRKMYINGQFTNINLKFRLYDLHYLGNTTKVSKSNDYSTTQPMKAFALLSSCIFPFGNEGSGGSFEEFVTILSNSLKLSKDSPSVTTVKNLLYNFVGIENKNDNSMFQKAFDELKKRAQGCPTIIIDEFGDRNFDTYNDKLEFFVTNLNASFSKDMIKNGEILYPIYVDFELTLQPTILPSLQTIQKWLMGDTDSNLFNLSDVYRYGE